MRIAGTALAALLMVTAAHATEGAPPAPVTAQAAPAPDPSVKITLTLGQLLALVAAQVAEARAHDAAQAAQGAIKAVQDQIAPAAPRP